MISRRAVTGNTPTVDCDLAGRGAVRRGGRRGRPALIMRCCEVPEDQTVAAGHSVDVGSARWQELFDELPGEVASRFGRMDLRRRASAFVRGLLRGPGRLGGRRRGLRRRPRAAGRVRGQRHRLRAGGRRRRAALDHRGALPDRAEGWSAWISLGSRSRAGEPEAGRDRRRRGGESLRAQVAAAVEADTPTPGDLAAIQIRGEVTGSASRPVVRRARTPATRWRSCQRPSRRTSAR
jgi:hypothetical protein